MFYDGVNEIYHALFFNNPAGWTLDDLQRERLALPAHRRLIHDIYERLYYRSRFVTYFMDPYDSENPPTHILDRAKFDRLLKNLQDSYIATIVEANRYCADKGVEFHHFLQPNLFTVAKPSAYERKLAETRHFTPAGLETSFVQGYPLLQQAVRLLASQGISSTDLTAALDERSAGEEFYFDFCHVNHEANRVIAESIAPLVARGRERRDRFLPASSEERSAVASERSARVNSQTIGGKTR